MTNDPATAPSSSPAGDEMPITTEAQIMARYGIVRRSVDFFHIGPYRYTNLGDAVAEAKRSKGKN